MTDNFAAADHPHRRYNPLTGDYVLVSPHRAKRPWQGQTEPTEATSAPAYVEDCFLCPGNLRVTGERNPVYQRPFVFTNDFAALKADTPEYHNDDPLFKLHAEQGESRVVCYSADHSLTLPELPLPQIKLVIEEWINQYLDLSTRYQWVQIFENKGAINGCSNPHPHGQIWASANLPSLVATKDRLQKDYFIEQGKVLLLDYLNRELTQPEQRVVVHNPHWVALVPFWAAWPYETLVLPRRHITQMTELTEEEKAALADILKQLTIRYDNLFNCSFPYSMGWHGAPFNQNDHQHWLLHAIFYPPLLRSASIKKFMVGYEMLCESQRDITPEQAADLLRQQPAVHYKSA